MATNTRQQRSRVKQQIDRLSDDRLQVAEDFLTYLEQRESDEATAQLLRIPGLAQELRDSERELKAHGGTKWRELRDAL